MHHISKPRTDLPLRTKSHFRHTKILSRVWSHGDFSLEAPCPPYSTPRRLSHALPLELQVRRRGDTCRRWQRPSRGCSCSGAPSSTTGTTSSSRRRPARLGAVYQREERRRPPHRPPRASLLQPAFLGPFPQGTEGRWLTPSTLLPVAPALSTILVQSLWDRWSYTIYLSPLQKGDLVNSFSTLQQTNYHLILVYKIPYIISIFY